jgi:hypothetical protein
MSSIWMLISREKGLGLGAFGAQGSAAFEFEIERVPHRVPFFYIRLAAITVAVAYLKLGWRE